MKGALVHRYQRSVRDHAVDLGDPLHDPDHYLRRLDVSADGLVVIGGGRNLNTTSKAQ
jgi:hypothetical protein